MTGLMRDVGRDFHKTGNIPKFQVESPLLSVCSVSASAFILSAQTVDFQLRELPGLVVLKSTSLLRSGTLKP